MNNFGSNNYRNDDDNMAENHRIGRRLAHENPHSANGEPNPEGYTSYRHHGSPNYRHDFPQDFQNRQNQPYNQQNQPYNQQQYSGYNSNRQFGGNQNHYNQPYNEGARHHDTGIWTERNDYKDDDYRYRSGNRNYWHEEYDQQYENRPQQHQHPDNFFTHIGQGIRHGWNNMFHRNNDENQNDRYNQENNNQHRNNWQQNPAYRNYNDNRQSGNRNPQSSEWHNSGPDHRDERFFDSRDFGM